MKTNASTLAAALFALLLGPFNAAAQIAGPEEAGLRPDAGFSVEGRVFLGTQPPGDHPVDVRLVGNGMAIQHQAFTDRLGNFGFRSLRSGAYRLQVQAEGYEPVEQIIDVSRGSDQVITTTIVLNRAEGAETTGSETVDLTEYDARYPAEAVRAHDEARRMREEGRLDAAITLLETVLEETPDYYPAVNTLGICYQEAGRPNEARRQFLKARELNPRSEEPLINLGRLYLQAGEAETTYGSPELAEQTFRGAATLLSEAVELNPRSALAHYFLGSALYKSGDHADAAATLGRAREIDAGFLPVYLMQANVYLRMERYEDVVATLDAYLTLAPEGPERAAAEAMRAQILKLINDR